MSKKDMSFFETFFDEEFDICLIYSSFSNGKIQIKDVKGSEEIK